MPAPSRSLARHLLGFGAVVTLALGAWAAAAGAQRPGEPEETENGDVVRARFEYFYQQRRFPFDRIPLRYTRAQMLRLRSGGVAGGPRFDVLPNTVSAWTPLGPAPIAGSYSGRVTALAVDPRDSRVAYAGGAQGGVWKTTDAGTTWTPLTDQQCSLAIGAITLDPVSPDIVYAGTGEQNFSGDSYYGCGVLRSTDGGASWTQLGGEVFDKPNGGATVARLWVDRATAGSAAATTVFAATSVGLWRSANSGATWTQVLSTGFGWVTDVVADPNDPRAVYAAATSIYSSASNGLYKSTDGGLTFVRLAGFPTTDIGRIALAAAATGPGAAAIYAAVESASSGDLQGIYRSTDGGTTWASTTTTTTSFSCNRQCWYNLALAVDPANANTVYLGTVGLFRSLDGGTTFTNVTSPMHVDQHAIAIDPSAPLTVWAGNDGGVYRTTTAGASWASLNQTLALTQFYPGVSLSNGSAFRLLGGTQDNGTLEYTGVPQWTAVIGSDGGYTATDPVTDGVAYGETQWISSSSYSGPRKRAALGMSFPLSASGIDASEPGLFIAPLVLDAARPATLYFGTRRLYRSRNAAVTWSGLPSLPSGLVSAIAPAPSDSLTVYVGSSGGGVFVTRDGSTWQPEGTGLPGRFVTDIVVHGANPAIAYATVSGFGTGHVFRTADAGATWQNVSGNLPDIPVSALVVLPGGELDVGTDLGVFRSADGGGTWSPFVGGLPNVAVTDLVFHRPSGTLVAATHGRGAFAATVNVVAPAVSLWVDSQPASAVSGAPIAPIAVSAREAAGSLVPTAAALVSARIASGVGTLSGTTMVATSGGVATFSNLTVVGTGPFVLAFSASGLADASTAPIAVGAPAGLSLSPTSRRAVMLAGAAAARTDSLDVVFTGGNAATEPWTATHAAAWSTLAAASGTGPARLRWSRSSASLGAGTYVDTIAIVALGAQGSPARLLDTLVVVAGVPATVASLVPDTLRGATGQPAAADLVIDVPASSGLTLGAYAATVTWDSTVVRLDTVTAADFGAPTAITRLSAAAVRVSGAGSAPSGGPLAVARLHLRLTGGAGTAAAVTPTFAALIAAGTDPFDLLPGLTAHAATVIVGGVLRGDVDGDGKITATDARLILLAVTGGVLPSGARAYPAGDADCDGQVTARDAQIVLAFVAGRAVPATACVGSVR